MRKRTFLLWAAMLMLIFVTGCSNSSSTDPVSSGKFEYVEGLMGGDFCGCSAISLSDSKIVVIGREKVSFSTDPSFFAALIYDVETGDFSPTANQPLVNRDYTTVTALSSGKILITGGSDADNDYQVLKSAEIYDPTTNRFSMLAAELNFPRTAHSATMLDNGQVLIAGGQTDEQGTVLTSAEVYDPSTGEFSLLSSVMTTERKDQDAVKLNDGRVLLLGGWDGEGSFLRECEVYDPVEKTFSAAAQMIETRNTCFLSTLLPGGNVLVTGGLTEPNQPTLRSAELYNVQTGLFEELPDMTVGRSLHFSILFQNDEYVLIGGGAPTTVCGALASLEVYDIQNRTFDPVAHSMKFARREIKNAAIRDSRGNVLVFGGVPGSVFAFALPQADIISVLDGSSAVTGGMNKGRTWHSSTTLTDGTVLITGGFLPRVGGQQQEVSNTADLYDPASGRFSFTQEDMASTRANHTATLLLDQTVLLVGGGDTDKTAELYLPDSKTFVSPAGQMQENRIGGHAATLLLDGSVLITGGVNDYEQCLDIAEIYDPETGSFVSTTGPMTTPRTSHTATILDDGSVLITAGSLDMHISNALNSAELYDPETSTFSRLDAKMASTRTLHRAALLGNGTVLIAGGKDNQGQVLSSAEIYDPNTGKFQTLSNEMTTPRVYHTLTMLANGNVLVTGGANGIGGATIGEATASFEIFYPLSGQFGTNGSMQLPRYGHGASLLDSGSVLVSGGRYIGFGATATTMTAEVFTQ